MLYVGVHGYLNFLVKVTPSIICFTDVAEQFIILANALKLNPSTRYNSLICSAFSGVSLRLSFLLSYECFMFKLCVVTSKFSILLLSRLPSKWLITSPLALSRFLMNVSATTICGLTILLFICALR